MKNQNKSKHFSKPSMSSMNAPKPMLDAPMIDPNMSLDLNDDSSIDPNVERIADILAQRLKEHKYKQFRQNLPHKQRRKLLKYYYPLPQFTKSIGWCLLILFSMIGAYVILLYGLKFDILHYANIRDENNIYLISECPSNLTDISVSQLMQYSVDQQGVQDFVQPNYRGDADGSFGEDLTDSRRFVLAIGFSVIQSVLLWQPVIILCFTILVIVNYVAGKSADMSLWDYVMAILHILFCRFCSNYRAYTREQEEFYREEKDKRSCVGNKCAEE